MKLNRKGFTLIELLAVIVVLGIILVIAIPKVVDTIENSRKGSFEASVKSFIKSAGQYVAKKEVEGAMVTSGNISNLDMQNKNGWEGKWVSNNGVITFDYIYTNDYVAYNATSDSVISSKLTEPFSVLPTDNSIALSEVGLTLNGTTLSGTYSTTAPKNIIIPEDVKWILANYKDKGLESVIFSEGLEEMLANFQSNNFTTIVLPTTLNTLGSMSNFANCSNLTLIVNKSANDFDWGSTLICQGIECEDTINCTANPGKGNGNSFSSGSCTINEVGKPQRIVTITE